MENISVLNWYVITFPMQISHKPFINVLLALITALKGCSTVTSPAHSNRARCKISDYCNYPPNCSIYCHQTQAGSAELKTEMVSWAAGASQGTLKNAQCTLYTAPCTLHTAHCTRHTAHCSLHTAHCTLHTALPTAYCRLYSAHCTLNTCVQWTEPKISQF